MHDFFHAHDPSRPVQYEGVAWDPRYPATTDFYSEMYTPAAQIEEFLKTNRAKPFILQEYAHAMNNSFGAVDEYLDLAEREPLFQGGFIWDFSDQAILLTDRHGEDFFGYGGDCGEAPHDYEFSGNGIFFADHSETPKLQEVRYLYRDLRVAIGESDFAVDNRYYATRSSAFDCLLTLARDGVEVASAVVATDVAPGAVGSYPVPFPLPEAPGEYALNVTFKLPAATAWAEAGHEVSWEQKVWTVAGKPALARPAPRVVDATHNVGVHSPRASALFSRIWGGLTSYQVDGREVFKSVPQPCFWHAPTSNERGWSAPFYDAQWLPASRYARPDAGRRGNPLTVAERDGVAEVSYRLLLPTAPESACELAYRCFGDGRVEVTATLQPGAGLGDPPEFGLLFQADADLTRWRWYGEGPEECYWDRRNGARLGIYETEVAGALTPYLRPQEAGNRTGVRWAEVTDETGWGLRFEADEPMEFSALPWSPFEAENARHPNELPPSNATWLRPAWRRRGVAGDNSWGARTHPQYLLPAGEQLVFRFSFQPA
jgi:beta-galactosidase